ncbi:hypothetical protein LTR78_006649 [Recurvomyces mirabilis]|uniref:Uncharacterized protein n=1 Tax=Recurvomyces mirabilis TaxID=574656 RepID=A0AAE1BZI6_9PEZI|nr:hypothetical protein LTR78_006649 [Recurvomyces mirabilis]KAK5151462.1 hypothetical protein LTS14_009305 [Recurvomyces mirabilis]
MTFEPPAKDESMILVCHQLHDEFRDVFDRVRGVATHIAINTTNFSYAEISPVARDIEAGRFSPIARFDLAVEINKAFRWPFDDLRLVQAGFLVGDARSDIDPTGSPYCIPYDCTVQFMDDSVDRDYWNHLVNQVMPGFVVELGEDMLQVDRVAKAFEAALREVKKGSCTYYSVPPRRTTYTMNGDSVRSIVSPAMDSAQRAMKWFKKNCSITSRQPERKHERFDNRWKVWQNKEIPFKIEHVTHDASKKSHMPLAYEISSPSVSRTEQTTFNIHQRTGSGGESEAWRVSNIVGAPVMGVYDTV